MAFGKIPLKHLSPFLRQMSTMVDAGVPIRQVFETLKNNTPDRTFRKHIQEMSGELARGNSLASVFNTRPRQFPPFMAKLISIGEDSGNLEVVCKRLADYYEWRGGLKRFIIGRLIYPAILVVVLILVIYVQILFLYPALRRALEGSGPMFDFASANAYLLGVAATFAGVVGAILIIRHLATGSYIMDSALIHMPIFGKVFLIVAKSRFFFSFNLMYASGLHIPDALIESGVASNNRAFEKMMREAASNIKKNMSITEVLDRSRLFSSQDLNMIATGEEGGRLDDTLGRMSAKYMEDAQFTIEWATKIFAGIVYAVIAVIIAIFVITFYASIYGRMIGGIGT